MPRALNVPAAAASADRICVEMIEFGANGPSEGGALVQVHAAGINPSDAKAMLGLMPSAVFPRTPGRDYAGIVVEGPKEWLGAEVWGSGGDLGISRNGSHAELLRLPVATLSRKPANLRMAQAGTVGVPFVTAHEGLRRAGFPQAGEAIAVFGASGKVGQAVTQLGCAAGAKVFAVNRRGDAPRGASARYVDASREDPIQVIRDETAGRGARIAFNCVGSPWFAQANAVLAKRGTQVFIATLERAVPFDIFAFYRGIHTYVGIDTLALPAAECKAIFDALAPGFANGALRPYPLDDASALALDAGAAAYRAVLEGSPRRLFFSIAKEPR